MTPLALPPEQLEERIASAFGITGLDSELLEKLEQYGYKRNEIIEMCNSFHERLKAGEITCATVRNEIRTTFPKRNPQARRLAIDYREQMLNWVNGASQFPYPPNYSIQKLPAITSGTLIRYLRLFERYKKGDTEYTPPDTSIEQEELQSRNDYLEMVRHRVESDSPGLLKNAEVGEPIANLNAVLKEFINQNEDNALQVFLYIISLNSSNQISYYNDLMQECLRRLSGNIHFIRSLFNLIDENTYMDNPKHPIHGNVMPSLLNSLIETNIVSDARNESDAISNSEPRDYQFHRHTVFDPATNEQIVFRMKIPSNYLPIHWNGTRLVNPVSCKSFQEFSSIIEKDENIDKKGKVEEIIKCIDELENNRRYGLVFSRMKVTDIPGTDDMDIWFHFSHDENMDSGEIQIGVVVNDAEIVYHFDGRYIEMRHNGIMIPRKQNPPPGHLDRLYEDTRMEQWATHEAQDNLAYYILKYAHILLVLPRNEGERPERGVGHPTDNPFSLRLAEHSTTTHIPGHSTGQGGNHRSRTVTAVHIVDAFVRKLPKDYKASLEAISNAARQHIFLVPGQTFVDSHTRGTEGTEQGRSGRGIIS